MKTSDKILHVEDLHVCVETVSTQRQRADLLREDGQEADWSDC